LIFAIFVFFVVKTNQGIDMLVARFCRGTSPCFFHLFDTEVGFMIGLAGLLEINQHKAYLSVSHKAYLQRTI